MRTSRHLRCCHESASTKSRRRRQARANALRHHCRASICLRCRREGVGANPKPEVLPQDMSAEHEHSTTPQGCLNKGNRKPSWPLREPSHEVVLSTWEGPGPWDPGGCRCCVKGEGGQSLGVFACGNGVGVIIQIWKPHYHIWIGARLHM